MDERWFLGRKSWTEKNIIIKIRTLEEIEWANKCKSKSGELAIKWKKTSIIKEEVTFGLE